MPSTILPYDPYHPHLYYTFAVTCLAWLSITLYAGRRLRRQPQQRARLYALAILLPIIGETGSYLIYLIRPEPDTAIGATLSYIHTYYVQAVPIDFFLTTLTAWILVGFLGTMITSALLRYALGTWQLRRLLRHARPLDPTSEAAITVGLRTIAARQHVSLPQIAVLNLDTPIAFVTGLLRPRVYASVGLFQMLKTEEALAVLCHEWAHVLRRDTLWNSLVWLVRQVIWFLPGSRWLWQPMVDSEDEACDRMAAEMSGKPLALARALVSMANIWHSPKLASTLQFTSSFALGRSSIQARVEQMIRISDARAELEHGQVRGSILLGGGLILLSMLPALLGS